MDIKDKIFKHLKLNLFQKITNTAYIRLKHLFVKKLLVTANDKLFRLTTLKESFE